MRAEIQKGKWCWVFETAKELAEFVKGFEEQQGKTLDVSYFKLTAVLRHRKENRTVDQESDKYVYREITGQDSLTVMKLTEIKQHPNDTKWMLKKETTMTKE